MLGVQRSSKRDTPLLLHNLINKQEGESVGSIVLRLSPHTFIGFQSYQFLFKIPESLSQFCIFNFTPDSDWPNEKL